MFLLKSENQYKESWRIKYFISNFYIIRFLLPITINRYKNILMNKNQKQKKFLTSTELSRNIEYSFNLLSLKRHG